LHGGSATAAGTTRLRARGALVVGEVAVAFVVLVGAGLMLRSFARLMTTNLGYDPQNVVTAHVDLNWTKYRARESSAQFAQSLMDRLRSASGIRAVAVANAFPASSTTPQNKSTFDIRGMPASDSARQPKAEVNIVSPEYFRAIGVPLRAGRAFTDADRDTSAVVAVVSQATAHRYFANGDALGKQITLDNGKHWFTIVGVVGDVRQFGPATEVPEQVYLPYAVFPTRDVRVLVRTAGAPLVAVNLIRETVRGLDAQQPVIDIRTLEQARQDSIASPKLTTILLALFAVLALIIAAAGLGGVMAYSVGQRTQEFGLRMALGAERGSVLRLVLGQGVRLVVAGLVVGVLASRLSAHAIAKLLYGVQAGDPLTYGGVAAVFIVVAILACLAPARRATSVDPVSALKAG
jgi:putative ABC transport system permease protein